MYTETGETRLPLDTAVSWSDHVFAECRHVANYPGRDDFPSLALFRHMIKMADGIQILLSAGTSDPTIPLLRSMLEALLGLKFIHLDNYKHRSLCWLCAYIHQEIARKELADISSGSGKNFHDVLTERDIDLTDPDLAAIVSRNRNEIARLREELQHPDFKQIEEKYCGLQKKGRNGRGPSWSRLAGVKDGNYGLAKAVGMLVEYKVFYEWWSATVHGSDATRLLFTQEDGSTEFTPLRSLQHPERLEQGAQAFLHLAYSLMMRKFLGERNAKQFFSDFFAKNPEGQ